MNAHHARDQHLDHGIGRMGLMTQSQVPFKEF